MLILLAVAICVGFSVVRGIDTPSLQYAFTLTTTNQAIGAPVRLFGYNQTSGVNLNATISGPLLNATSASLSFAEQIYSPAPDTNVTYSASQAYGIFVTDDGEQSFFYSQTGVANDHTNVVQTILRGIGGKYAYLQKYLFLCYSPLYAGSAFNNTAPSSSSISSGSGTSTATSPLASASNEPINTSHGDCFVVGGV